MKPSLKKELLEATKHLAKKRILVVGDLMLDVYVQGRPRAVSQEAPVLILDTEKKYYKLGGAANSAENIRALGSQALLVGVVGDGDNHEDFGRSFLETVRASGMETRGVLRDPKRRTTLKMRIMASGQQVVRVDEEDTKDISASMQAKLLRYIRAVLPKVDGVLVSDYQKGVVTASLMRRLVLESHRQGKSIVVDPKPKHKKFFRDVDFLTPNDVDLCRMHGLYEVDQTKVLRLAKDLQAEMRIRNVLLTRGAKGMELFDEKGKRHHIPTYVENVVDVSGAGDTVSAVVSLTARRVPPVITAHLAAVAAKRSVEKSGTATVTVKEIRDTLRLL